MDDSHQEIQRPSLETSKVGQFRARSGIVTLCSVHANDQRPQAEVQQFGKQRLYGARRASMGIDREQNLFDLVCDTLIRGRSNVRLP